MKVSTVLLRGACVSALLAVTSVVFAAPPQGYYRWKDDAGAEHFTQQPPAGRKSDFVAVSTGKSTEVPAGESIESNNADKTPTKPSNKPIGPMQGVPDKDPEKCKQAKDTQGVLGGHARIREKVGDDYRYLTPEEIDEQKKLAQESADIYCEPTPAK